MSIRIDDDAGHMTLTAGDTEGAADRLHDGKWEVAGYPGRRFDRDQAITALTIVEFLAAGGAPDDPHVIAWNAELREGV